MYAIPGEILDVLCSCVIYTSYVENLLPAPISGLLWLWVMMALGDDDKGIKKLSGSIHYKVNPGCLSQGLKRKKKKKEGKETDD